MHELVWIKLDESECTVKQWNSILLLSEGQAGEIWEPLNLTCVLVDIRENGIQIALHCFVQAVGRLMCLSARMNKRKILGSNRDCTRSWYSTSAKCSQIVSGAPLILGRQLWRHSMLMEGSWALYSNGCVSVACAGEVWTVQTALVRRLEGKRAIGRLSISGVDNIKMWLI